MNAKGRITNVRLGTDPAGATVSVEWEDGHFVSINGSARKGVKEVDGGGGWLIPGLFDLHCDTLERVVEPRPRVHFDYSHSLRVMDRRMLNVGMTTVYHALSIAGDELGLRSPETAEGLISAIQKERSKLAANHKVHLRFEITDTDSVPLVLDLIERGWVELVSFMDHTPGQGQFPDEAAYLRYLMLTYGRTEREAVEISHHKQTHTRPVKEAMATIAKAAHKAKIPIAAHDLDETEQAATFAALGASISEFPLNLSSAKASQEAELKTLFGSPNIIRGESSGQGMRALDAVEANVADGLCSDYAPETLLPALGRLKSELGLPWHKAVHLGTTGPASMIHDPRAAGITPGAPADFLTLHPSPDQQLELTSTWVAGNCRVQWPR
jgi:alpha-D-ribose 1-methylphosphonate 5-triphosphate diphosphatase